MKCEGTFRYFIDGVELFDWKDYYNTTTTGDYMTQVDGLNVYATSYTTKENIKDVEKRGLSTRHKACNSDYKHPLAGGTQEKDYASILPKHIRDSVTVKDVEREYNKITKPLQNILTPSEDFTNDVWAVQKEIGTAVSPYIKTTEEDLIIRQADDSPWKLISGSKKTEGYKETEGKLDYSEINFELLDLMAKRFMENKKKYPKGNTKKDIDKDEILWAAFRHIRKMLQPIENDPETYEDHLAAVATNLSIILDQLRK